MENNISRSITPSLPTSPTLDTTEEQGWTGGKWGTLGLKFKCRADQGMSASNFSPNYLIYLTPVSALLKNLYHNCYLGHQNTPGLLPCFSTWGNRRMLCRSHSKNNNKTKTTVSLIIALASGEVWDNSSHTIPRAEQKISLRLECKLLFLLNFVSIMPSMIE